MRVYFDTGVFIDYLSARGSANALLRSSEPRVGFPACAGLLGGGPAGGLHVELRGHGEFGAAPPGEIGNIEHVI